MYQFNQHTTDDKYYYCIHSCACVDKKNQTKKKKNTEKLNKKNKHFQLKNFYDDIYMKTVNDTLDDFTGGITVEGALKHPLRNNKTLQDEPLKIGYHLAEVLAEI